jgi:tetratricopeptide (TPR) repeat protein
LFIDDIQWCDRSSLDLLARIGSALSLLPVVLVATYEATEADAAVSIGPVRRRVGANAVDLAVRALEADAILNVMDRALDGSSTKEFGALVVSAAKGNPFYAEQIVRWLGERKKVRRRLLRYSVAASDMPRDTKVEALVAGRVDALEPNLRWTLEAASLCGSVIDSAVVARQLGQEESAVAAQLRKAQTVHGFLAGVGEYKWMGGRRSSRFQFSHPLIGRSLSDHVTGKRRAHLLSRAAESLEKLAGRGAGEIADEIAGLYLRAEPGGQAKKWSVKGAELAERLYAPYEMECFLGAAARITTDQAERLRIEHNLARMFAATGREPEAEKLLEHVFEGSRALDDRKTEVSAGSMLGWLRLERGIEPSRLAALSGHLVDAARQSGDAGQLISALDFACVVAERVGRAEEALLMAEEALHVGDGSGDVELSSQAAYRLARVHIFWGDPQDGKELAARALEGFGGIDAPDAVAACHDLVGLASFRAGDWDDALHHWTSALERLEAAGVPEQRITMQSNIAELKTFRGEFTEAEEAYKEGLRLAEELDDTALVLRLHAGLARLEFERGDYAAVLELTEAIRERLPDSGAWREDFHTTAVRALAYLELGDELQAWQEAVRLEQLYQGKEGWFERRAEGDAVRIRVIDLDADSWLAGMVADQGIGETTDKDLYGEGFLQYHRACVLSRNKPGDARAAAERAEEIFSKLAAKPMLNRARELLNTLPADAAAGEPQGADGDGDLDDEKLDKWFDSLEG